MVESCLVSDGEEADSPVMSREDHIGVYCAPSDPPWIKDNLDKFLRGSLPIMVESILSNITRKNIVSIRVIFPPPLVKFILIICLAMECGPD